VVRVTGAGIKAAGLPSGAAPPWLMWWQVPNRTGAWRPTAWLGRQDSNLRMACFDVVTGVDLSEPRYFPTMRSIMAFTARICGPLRTR